MKQYKQDPRRVQGKVPKKLKLRRKVSKFSRTHRKYDALVELNEAIQEDDFDIDFDWWAVWSAWTNFV